MATPAQLIPTIEGMLSYNLGSAAGEGSAAIQGSTVVTTWLKMLKVLLYSEDFRYLDDLSFTLSDDIVDVGIVVSADATHFIAGLFEVYLELGTDTSVFMGYTDADTDTIVIGTALDTQEDVITVLRANDLVTTGVSEFYSIILPAGASGAEAAPATYSQQGQALKTGLTVWADGNDGNPPAAATIRAWTLFRT